MFTEYQLAKKAIVLKPARYSFAAFKYALRLKYFNAGLVENLEDYFSANEFRKMLWRNEEFRRDIYLQQLRACFYKNSSAEDRLYFLKSHFDFMEATHKAEILGNIYQVTQPPIMLHQGEHQLGVKLMYHHDAVREGLLWLVIEFNNQIILKITFWLMLHNNKPTLCISAFQGGKETLETNREFTKYFFGLRPQNMGMQALRWYAESLGVEQIYSFPIEKIWSKKIKDRAAVEEFLAEQGATKVEATPYVALNLEETRKTLEEIPSKKRSMYKKRFEFLDQSKSICQTAFVDYFSTNARSIT